MAGIQQGDALLFPHIINKVFTFLPAKTICKAASLCQVWNAQAKTVLKQRPQYAWDLFIEDQPRDGDGTVVIKFLQSLLIQYIVKDLPIRPSTVMIFVSKKLKTLMKGPLKKGRRKGCPLLESLVNNLPPTCRILCTAGDSIIGTSSCMEIHECEQQLGATILCFGESASIDVVPFVAENTIGNKFFTSAVDTFNSLERADFQDVQAILLTNDKGEMRNHKVEWRHHRRPLFVGGIAEKTRIHGPFFEELTGEVIDLSNYPSPGSSRLSNHLFGERLYHKHVLIRGENVQVACVMFSDSVQTRAQVEREILRLRDMTSTFPMVNSVAFMFSCVARGFFFYHEQNVESSIFKRYFPSTPIFGYFGQGELGFEYPLKGEEKPPPKLGHTYSTFIVVVSFP